MKKYLQLTIVAAFISLIVYANPASFVFATEPAHETLYNNAQYKDTLDVSGKPTIAFIKNDLSVIDWSNPISVNDITQFGMVARFDLENIEEIIDKVSTGQVGSIPSSYLQFIGQLRNQAEIVGSFDLTIDINPGLGSYFTVNQQTLSEIQTNPTLLFGSNTAFTSTFDITSVTESNNIITISVAVKNGVTGGDILNLKSNFQTLDFTIANLFNLNPALWSQVDAINRGQFEELVTISAPATTFIVNIPSNLVALASVVGARNPFVGIKLNTDPTSGALNLGFVVIYDGNGHDQGTPPVDAQSPYADTTSVSVRTHGSLKRSGYRFKGWSSVQNAQSTDTIYAANDTFAIRNNTILYAQWEALDADSDVRYTIYYKDEKGKMLAPTVTGTQKFQSRYTFTALTLSGYTLLGTQTQSDITGEEDFEITFVYRANVVAVTFESNGGSQVPVQTLEFNGTATKPGIPTKSGSTFVDWFKDAALTQPYDFSSPVTEDITLYAKWTQRPDTLPDAGLESDQMNTYAILSGLLLINISIFGYTNPHKRRQQS